LRKLSEILLGEKMKYSHVSQESVKRYIQEQEGKKVFEYDIYECPEELKGQLKIGDFY